MDIRDLFKRQALKNEGKPIAKKEAPVIVDSGDDDDDFKSSSAPGGGGGGKKRSSQRQATKRKRARARIKESDSEEEVATKKSKSNPTKGAMIPKTKSPKTPAKAKEIKSVSDFFGSAPIKRSSEIISRSPGTSGGKGNRLEKRELSKNGKQGEDVVVIPESPTDMAGFEFDDEAIAMALQEDEMEGRKEAHEDKDLSETLEQKSSRPSSATPTKHLRIVMKRIPFKQSPSKPTPPSKHKDSDFTDSPILTKKEDQTKADSKNVTPKHSPPQKRLPVRSRAQKRIMYINDGDDNETSNIPSPAKKPKTETSPVKNQKDSPRKIEASPVKTKQTELSPVKLKPSSMKKTVSLPAKAIGQATPIATAPQTTPKSITPVSSSTTPSGPPKLSKADSYWAYRNRGGPKAPGSKTVPDGEEDCLEGLTFVITGVLDSLEREEASDLIKKYGGKVTGNVSKKTKYIIVGEEAGQSKLAKATSFGTKQIDEDGFLELIRTRPGKQAPTGKKGAKKKSSSPKPKPTGPATPMSLVVASPVATPTSSLPATPTSTPLPVPPPTPLPGTESLLWVDKYAPKSTKHLIGQQGDRSNAKKLARWLQDWERNHGGGGGGEKAGKKPSGGKAGQDDGSAFTAALLSGAPGVGKTTTATLVCEEAGYTYLELNASATRSKRTLHDEVASLLGCLSMDAFVEGGGGATAGKRHALIMDEVDGMAGNEDRGGVQELIQLIKTTRIPIICICNDRQHQKIRSLSNYCFDLRFQKPRVDQIKGAMMSVCFKEGVKISPQALTEIIQASGQDVRQVLHNLCMWSAAEKSLSFEQAKESARKAKKEIKLSPFEVVRTVFMPREGERELSLVEKQELFFHDYNIATLFVQENYLSVRPLNAKGDIHRTLDLVSQTADTLCNGDVVEKRIRSSSRWELLPVQAMYSSVLPGELMRGFLGRPNFPQWLGNNSKRGRCDRTLQELQRHTRLVTSCNKTEFGMDYLPFLHSKLTQPLMQETSAGVPEVVSAMDAYDLIREDWDGIMELGQFTGGPEIVIPSKVKAAFTRSYNKEAHVTPYAVAMVTKKPRRSTADSLEDEDESETEEGEDTSQYQLKGVEYGKKGTESKTSKGKGKAGSQGGGKGKKGKGKT